MKSLVNSIYVAATLVLIPVSLPAQNEADKPTSRLKLGQIEGDVQYSKLTPSLLHFVGRITLTSDEYDLAAEDIKVFLHPGKGGASSKSAIEKATADGNSGKQVDVHVRRPLQSEAYEILADHAVYLPDPSRPGYGQMDFTGHVTVNSRSGFLVGPSVATMDKATLLLGPGSDYPQLTTGPAHITLTPAQ